ncbi:MAG: replication factor C large subunit, partial [Candidatus Bathyarchaeia archaeon]
AGVAMARMNTKTSGWTPFRFPERIQALSKSKEERGVQLEIGKKIKRKCHISATRASKEILPYLRIIFKNNAEMAAGIAKWLDLTPEMVEYIVEDREKAAAINKLLA